jgi:hypothetical protein
MATINMPKKELNLPKKEAGAAEAEPLKIDQRRAALSRYWLQVDRQTKASFDSMEEAEKRGSAIKKANPFVQVSVYDAQEHQQTIL